jgi:hypothetical protein
MQSTSSWYRRHYRWALASAITFVTGLIAASLVSESPIVAVAHAAAAVPHASGTNCDAGPVPPGSMVAMVATKDDGGYWMATNYGAVVECGDAPNYGNSNGGVDIVGFAALPDDRGYYQVDPQGGIFSSGAAPFHGSMSGTPLKAPIVGMAIDPQTGGYWLVAADGGIFAFDAPFYGSTGSIALNRPIVGMAATPDGAGYWFVAADGGIFAFGDAQFYGSTGGINLNKPVVGMAVDLASGGYWLVASDGGVFAYHAPFYGSTGNIELNRPIVGMEGNSAASGYRFVASDGGIFDYGTSGFWGSVVAPAAVIQPVGAVPTCSISLVIYRQPYGFDLVGVNVTSNVPNYPALLASINSGDVRYEAGNTDANGNGGIGSFSTGGEPVNSQDAVYVTVGPATCGTVFTAN